MVKKEEEEEENGVSGTCAALVAEKERFGGGFDWGNSQGREKVCFHCGKHGHVVTKCIVDMLADVKSKILNHAQAQITEIAYNINPEDTNFTLTCCGNYHDQENVALVTIFGREDVSTSEGVGSQEVWDVA